MSKQNDQSEEQDRERTNLNGNHGFASKIVLQSLEPDTDAQLHKERVISVRKEAEFASRVLQERCPRWNADSLETSRQCDVEEFQEMIKVAQKTVGTPQVPTQVQMIQTMTHGKVLNMVDARLREDNSAVARCNYADLEQTAAQSPG